MIRKRTFWFRIVFGAVVPVPRLHDGPHSKHVLHTRTMRGVWGEWW